jgi:hypothetical protein
MVTHWLPHEIALDLGVSNRWQALGAVAEMIERSLGLNASPIALVPDDADTIECLEFLVLIA